ncbi:MAG TPA: ATP-binding protein [Anaerolineae bacterium]|nr:ATP-binding protein [Anaerolineae bacterium]
MTNGEKSWDRILVIDDELGLREGCRRVLSRYRFQVDLAATGHEGLALSRQNRPALVLLDVMMPDVSGIELMHTLRADDPDIVCIIITGYATVELAVEAMKLGAYDFIAKPFSDDNLLLAVEKGLEKRRLEQESRRMQQAEEEARRLSQEKAMLEELDRVKTAFMRKVAHELRAPIAAIQSFLVSILAGYGSPEVQREMQERAVRRAGELLDLVNDLLNLSRLKDAKMELKKQEVSLKKVLDDVLSLHAPDAEQKRIVLDVSCDDCPPILADPSHIKQLWTNLISNAIKYTPEGGRVRVRLRAEDGSIVGDVEDTGIGISPEDMPHLFEEFFRTEKAKAFAQYGTGLGLSIARQIVTECGGEIGVESEVAKGTRFTFRLPAAPAPAP